MRRSMRLRALDDHRIAILRGLTRPECTIRAKRFGNCNSLSSTPITSTRAAVSFAMSSESSPRAPVPMIATISSGRTFARSKA